MTLISVIVIAGTGRPYLADALRSLVRQDMTAWEAIVVESCAFPEDTEKVRRQIHEVNDPRVHVISYDGDRAYPPRAARKWNLGIKRATAPLIAFLDDDDMKEDNWLYAMSAPLRDLALSTTLCDLIEIDSEGIRGVVGASFDRAALVAGNFVTTGQMLVRRTVLDALGGFDEDLGCSEDYDLALRLSAFPWEVVRTTNHLHRGHVGNASQHPDVRRYTQEALMQIKAKNPNDIFPWAHA